jgi:hypothetical protein
VSGSEGIAVSPDGSTVAVAAQHADLAHRAVDPSIALIDTRSNALVRTLPTEYAVHPVHWTATGVLLAGEVRTAADTGVASDGGSFAQMPAGQLAVWAGPSAAEVERVGTVEVGAMPLTLTSSPDGARAYLANVITSTVSVVDLADPARPTVVDTLDVPRAGEPGAHGMAYITGA